MGHGPREIISGDRSCHDACGRYAHHQRRPDGVTHVSGSEIAVAERMTPADLLQRSRDRLRASKYDDAVELASRAAAGDDPSVRAEALSVLANCRRLRDE
jgi:hypothetical protein